MQELKKEIVHFTHNDLDAMGCIINLNYAMPDIKKTIFHTNYQDLNEKVHDVIEYIHKHPVSLLVISDISFAQSKHELLHIQEVVQNQIGVKILYFDHHTYADNFFEDITFRYYHELTKSATLIMNKAFNVNNEKLNQLSQLINDFDIWVEDAKTFSVSLGINDWFWNELKYQSIDNLAYSITNNDFSLPDTFVQYYKAYQAKFKNKLDSLKAKKLFINDGFTALVFTDDYFNEALYESFHINKNQIAFIVNSYGIIRIRFATVDCLSTEIKEKIKFAIMGTLEHGHLNAFSIKVKNSNFEKLMTKVQELTQIVNTNKG